MVFSIDQFFLYGCKKPRPHRDSNHLPPDPWPPSLTTALRVTQFSYAATGFILATSLTSFTSEH